MNEAKKLKLIYNPYSGDRSFPDYLDECISVFQSGGYETHILRSSSNSDIEDNISTMPKDYYDAVVISGGDGTINIVLNALLKNDINVPIGIIPSGTANDFATYLKIPTDVERAAKVIINNKMMDVDVGLAGDRYFINVCGAGFLTNISQNIDNTAKNLLGKLAYYLKGIGQLPSFSPLKVRITNSIDSFEEDIFLFIALNSAGTGGFEALSPNASLNDGKFDFIAFKAMPIMDMAKIFVRLLAGEHLKDPNIIYFQDNYIKIEPLFKDKALLETDLDGEAGPNLPIEIRNLNNKIKVFCI